MTIHASELFGELEGETFSHSFSVKHVPPKNYSIFEIETGDMENFTVTFTNDTWFNRRKKLVDDYLAIHTDERYGRLHHILDDLNLESHWIESALEEIYLDDHMEELLHSLLEIPEGIDA